MLNIEKYRAKLENYEIPLDCYIRQIREKNDSCGSKQCVECRKENMQWLLSEHQILDDAEKRYLRGVIRPFRDKVKSITKFADTRCTEEYIYMVIEGPADACLPRFDGNTMYKGMELNREYTLEELGL